MPSFVISSSFAVIALNLGLESLIILKNKTFIQKAVKYEKM